MQQMKGRRILLVDKLLFALSHDTSVFDTASNDDKNNVMNVGCSCSVRALFEWLSLVARARDIFCQWHFDFGKTQ
jgi:hypothetical protein